MTTAPATQTRPPIPQSDAPVDRERRNPLLRWTLHLGVPMLVSLSIHALLTVLLVLTTLAGLTPRDYSAGEFEVGVQDASAGAASLGWSAQSLLSANELELPEQRAQFDIAELTNLGVALSNEGRGGTGGEGGGGFGVGDLGSSGVLGLGGGAGEPGGAEFGSGFGRGGGVGGATVWDLRAAGNTFCYVVDFSGSIVVVVEDLRRELKRSVGRLRPTQKFNAFVFYSALAGGNDRFVTESYSDSLQTASVDLKQKFFKWIDEKAPMGSTDPRQAIRRAIRMAPEVIFFFSDGYFEDRIIDDIRNANKNAKCRIHCLVFDETLLDDTSGLPRLTEGAHRLKRIADENGGKIKVVTGLDLRR